MSSWVRKLAQATRPRGSAARLKELVEEATVDAYEDEQRVGFSRVLTPDRTTRGTPS
jgi:hypothetical protein